MVLRAGKTTLVALVLLIAAGGCNVYEGLYEEGASDDPEVLLEDARIAIQQDRPAEAVQHLRRALDNAPRDTPLYRRIQVKLATAVMQEQEVNVLSLERIARNLLGESRATLSAPKTMGQTCSFPASHEREVFDPTDGLDFDRLESPSSQQALEESRALITQVFAGNDTAADPTFPCDEAGLDQAVVDLQADGMTKEEIAEALVNFAVANLTLTYLDIVETGGEATYYYATPPAGPDYIGMCFSSEQSCQDIVAHTRSNLASIDCSTRVLQKRASVLGSSGAQELANLAHDGYQNMAAGLENASCIVY